MDQVLNSDAVQALELSVEEATRSTEEGVKRFIEPAQGTLSRALAKRPHIVFGRRGSGKSSLLRKAVADLTVDRRPIAFVDLESFKGHSYPDVLISILIQTLERFSQWLDTAAVNPANRHSFWQKLFGATIRHRSSWYVNGDPPIGMKIGDDGDEIDLDLTLEKYQQAKDFLSRILKGFFDTEKLKIDDILTD